MRELTASGNIAYSRVGTTTGITNGASDAVTEVASNAVKWLAWWIDRALMSVAYYVHTSVGFDA